MDTSLLKCQRSYIPTSINMDTSVKQTLGSIPLLSVLKRFDCTCIAGGIYHMQLPFSAGPFIIVWALKPQEKWRQTNSDALWLSASLIQ